MTPANTISPKVTTAHQAKLAYVYIRQSSLSQVTRHGESTELQYRLAERAGALGWPLERIKVIDDDLGKSAASSEQRWGFQQLLAEIGLAQVGLVLSWDASRLARNNSDWHHLIELCSMFGVLIADGEQLYDPLQYHDRLLLGLSGMMSEAELHQLKLRLQAGERQKAERGELRLPLPAGLERQRDGRVILNPDEEIQARIRLVFAKFDELGSARAVMRYLVQHDLRLPTRPLQGAAPHPIVWQIASDGQVLEVLHNPAYAGAYTYGRSTRDPSRRRAGHPASGIHQRPLDHWPVCLQDHYPAYISWAQYLRNQQRLRDNQNRYQDTHRGVPRQGQALLQGIVLCGRCGARMRLRYSGPHGQYPAYTCRDAHHRHHLPACQQTRAIALDEAVQEQLLAALAPDKVALAMAALKELDQETETLKRHWQLRLERGRYDAERAERQFHNVEPENRLVARQLESQWEQKLRAVEELEHAYQRWLDQQSFALSDDDRQTILAVGSDLPTVWYASTTTAADRKHLVRLVIDSVIIDAKRERGYLWYQINWQTGATSEHRLRRQVMRLAEHPYREALQHRLQELSDEQKMDAEIAAMLNAEGFLTARAQPFTGQNVWRLCQLWQLASSKEAGKYPNPPRWRDGTYSISGAADRIGVTHGTVYKWVRQGRIQGQQPTKGAPWKIPLTDSEVLSLRDYAKRVRRVKRSIEEAS
ncbi:MAG: recombinase family protein [Candidatus Competibacteraceae bacterium]|jgi:excisionase family DNA binding protein|nr:recombinase family protein [Candidatus Competibacteraceae bacterium]